jgi:hypothetical protein
MDEVELEVQETNLETQENELFIQELPKENELIIQEEKTKTSIFFKPNSLIMIVIFISLYIASDLMLPLYNKLLFKGFGSQEGFHFPVSTSVVQVFSVGLILFIFEISKYLVFKLLKREENFFFSNFLFKM